MHFLCLVVGDDPHEALKPFADYLELPRRREFLDAEEVASMAEEYRLPLDDLDALAAKMQEWAREDGGVESGRLFRWSTSNPQAQYDYYKIGGRFDGYLELLHPRPPGLLGRLFGAKAKSRVNLARKSEVDLEAIRNDPPAALLLDGQWHECPISTDPETLTEWNVRFARMLDAIAPDALLTVVDVHS